MVFDPVFARSVSVFYIDTDADDKPVFKQAIFRSMTGEDGSLAFFGPGATLAPEDDRKELHLRESSRGPTITQALVTAGPVDLHISDLTAIFRCGGHPKADSQLPQDWQTTRELLRATEAQTRFDLNFDLQCPEWPSNPVRWDYTTLLPYRSGTVPAILNRSLYGWCI